MQPDKVAKERKKAWHRENDNAKGAEERAWQEDRARGREW